MKYTRLIILTILAVTANCLKNIGDYNFLPNQPVQINNPLLWTVKANCKIITIDKSDVLKANMKYGTATLNGNVVKDGIEVNLKNGDSLAITASSRAQVVITNNGANRVTASCGLSTKTKLEVEYIKSIIEEKVENLEFLQ
jgi:hypothetical protein